MFFKSLQSSARKARRETVGKHAKRSPLQAAGKRAQRNVSMGAARWLTLTRYRSAFECCAALRESGAASPERLWASSKVWGSPPSSSGGSSPRRRWGGTQLGRRLDHTACNYGMQLWHAPTACNYGMHACSSASRSEGLQ